MYFVLVFDVFIFFLDVFIIYGLYMLGGGTVFYFFYYFLFHICYIGY